MSLLYRLVIPMIDEELQLEDFDKNSGFVGIYAYNKNKPSLDRHIFLLYDMKKMDVNKAYKFSRLKNLYSKKIEFIKNKAYYVYTFPRISSDIDNLLRKGEKPKSIKNNNRITSFWRGHYDDISEYMFYRPWKLYNDWESVPEYDYRQSIEDMLL